MVRSRARCSRSQLMRGSGWVARCEAVGESCVSASVGTNGGDALRRRIPPWRRRHVMLQYLAYPVCSPGESPRSSFLIGGRRRLDAITTMVAPVLELLTLPVCFRSRVVFGWYENRGCGVVRHGWWWWCGRFGVDGGCSVGFGGSAFGVIGWPSVSPLKRCLALVAVAAQDLSMVVVVLRQASCSR